MKMFWNASWVPEAAVRTMRSIGAAVPSRRRPRLQLRTRPEKMSWTWPGRGSAIGFRGCVTTQTRVAGDLVEDEAARIGRLGVAGGHRRASRGRVETSVMPMSDPPWRITNLTFPLCLGFHEGLGELGRERRDRGRAAHGDRRGGGGRSGRERGGGGQGGEEPQARLRVMDRSSGRSETFTAASVESVAASQGERDVTSWIKTRDRRNRSSPGRNRWFTAWTPPIGKACERASGHPHRADARIANVEIRPAELQVLVDERRVGFTVREFELFLLLAERLDSVVQRGEIYELMWGGEMPRRDRSVDVLSAGPRQARADRPRLALHPHPFRRRLPLHS